MSALGFVKEQRVPTHIRGEDEVFQKELQAIRGKLAAKPGQSESTRHAGHWKDGTTGTRAEDAT